MIISVYYFCCEVYSSDQICYSEAEMTGVTVPELYKKYFIDKSDERRTLFQELNKLFKPEKGIYPGSFVHITPSFYISSMTYIDSDKRISKFFKDKDLYNFIDKNKTYDEKPLFNGFQEDYNSNLPIEEDCFDIMFSFYAGFISQSCKKYLKDDSVLVCNNSHGDASIAYTDPDYTLTSIVKRNGNKFRITDDDLSSYFRKKDGSSIDKDKVFKRMTGENFTKKGYAYIFRYHKADKS